MISKMQQSPFLILPSRANAKYFSGIKEYLKSTANDHPSKCFGKIGTEGEKQLGSASLPTGWRHKTSAGDVGPRTVSIVFARD